MSTALWGDYHARLQVASDIAGHLPYLHEQACARPAPVIIECGVRTGNSTAALLAALELLGAGELWSLDIAAPQVPGAWHDLDYWHFLQADDVSSEALAWAPPAADIVFLDTSHDYGHTLAELRAYAPRVRPGGLVLVHDTELITPHPREVGFAPQPPYPVFHALTAYCQEAGLGWENRPGSFGLGVIRIPRQSATLCVTSPTARDRFAVGAPGTGPGGTPPLPGGPA